VKLLIKKHVPKHEKEMHVDGYKDLYLRRITYLLPKILYICIVDLKVKFMICGIQLHNGEQKFSEQFQDRFCFIPMKMGMYGKEIQMVLHVIVPFTMRLKMVYWN
jgi:hypothetical protein